jgi:hypothetical protein
VAWEINIGYDITLAAAADLSAKQFFLVTVDSNGKAALSGAGEQSLGVLQNDPTSGKGAAVRVMGVTKVVYGAGVTAGDKVTSDASGKAIKATAASVSAGTPEPLAGSHVIGIALKTGVLNDVGSIALVHAGLTN